LFFIRRKKTFFVICKNETFFVFPLSVPLLLRLPFWTSSFIRSSENEKQAQEGPRGQRHVGAVAVVSVGAGVKHAIALGGCPLVLDVDLSFPKLASDEASRLLLSPLGSVADVK